MLLCKHATRGAPTGAPPPWAQSHRTPGLSSSHATPRAAAWPSSSCIGPKPGPYIRQHPMPTSPIVTPQQSPLCSYTHAQDAHPSIQTDTHTQNIHLPIQTDRHTHTTSRHTHITYPSFYSDRCAHACTNIHTQYPDTHIYIGHPPSIQTVTCTYNIQTYVHNTHTSIQKDTKKNTHPSRQTHTHTHTGEGQRHRFRDSDDLPTSSFLSSLDLSPWGRHRSAPAHSWPAQGC